MVYQVVGWVLEEGEALLSAQQDIGDSLETATALKIKQEQLEVKCVVCIDFTSTMVHLYTKYYNHWYIILLYAYDYDYNTYSPCMLHTTDHFKLMTGHDPAQLSILDT